MDNRGRQIMDRLNGLGLNGSVSAVLLSDVYTLDGEFTEDG
jgi:hypothetical protein